MAVHLNEPSIFNYHDHDGRGWIFRLRQAIEPPCYNTQVLRQITCLFSSFLSVFECCLPLVTMYNNIESDEELVKPRERGFDDISGYSQHQQLQSNPYTFDTSTRPYSITTALEPLSTSITQTLVPQRFHF